MFRSRLPTSRPASPSATTVAGSLDRRVGGILVVLAVLGYFLGASYGINGPFYYGHYGYHGGSYATWARGTLRHHTLYPVNEPGFATPDPRTYYIHHPMLTHQLVTLTFALLGQHEWSVRVAAMIPSFASLLLVTGIAWRYLGPLAGGAAGLVFSFVPVNIWYEAHIDQGFPSIACLLAFFWFYLGWLRAPRWRLGLAALFFQMMAGNFEWSPYFAFPAIFVHVAWTAFRRRGRYLTFALLHPLTVVLPLGFHFWMVHRANLVPDIIAAYHNRAAMVRYPFFATAMANYAEVLFGPALELVMIGWLLVVVVNFAKGWGWPWGWRWRWRRPRVRTVELVGFTFAFTLIVYMHVFKSAVMTHAYRQLYGNVWAALAAAALVGAGQRWGRRLFRRRPRGMVPAGLGAGLGILVLISVLTLPTSWAGLLESRLHGGVPLWKTFNPDLRQTAFAARLEALTRPGDVLYFHTSFAWPPPHRMDWAFYYDRDQHRSATLRGLGFLTPAERSHALVILYPNTLGGDELRQFATLASHHPVWEVEDLAVLDLRTEGSRLEAFRIIAPTRAPSFSLPAWLEGPYPHPVLEADPKRAARLAALVKRR